jgi:hypothetical protein
VAIAGRVTDGQTARGLGAVLVRITAAPAEFMAWLSLYSLQDGTAWAARLERPDQAVTASDGHFHFMDLPDGQYTLTASLPRVGSRYGAVTAQATVARTAAGKLIMAVANLTLPPTTLKGTITGPNGANVAMAQVRVNGSGECAYTTSQGTYLLAGLEVGNRTVSVTAQGFQPVARVVTLDTAGGETTLNFSLAPSTP